MSGSNDAADPSCESLWLKAFRERERAAIYLIG